jgi:hypothetical protein
LNAIVPVVAVRAMVAALTVLEKVTPDVFVTVRVADATNASIAVNTPAALLRVTLLKDWPLDVMEGAPPPLNRTVPRFAISVATFQLPPTENDPDAGDAESMETVQSPVTVTALEAALASKVPAPETVPMDSVWPLTSSEPPLMVIEAREFVGLMSRVQVPAFIVTMSPTADPGIPFGVQFVMRFQFEAPPFQT